MTVMDGVEDMLRKIGPLLADRAGATDAAEHNPFEHHLLDGATFVLDGDTTVAARWAAATECFVPKAKADDRRTARRRQTTIAVQLVDALCGIGPSILAWIRSYSPFDGGHRLADQRDEVRKATPEPISIAEQVAHETDVAIHRL